MKCIASETHTPPRCDKEATYIYLGKSYCDEHLEERAEQVKLLRGLRGDDWSKHRKALRETVEKYPKLLEDIIDASYLAGLEATKKV